MPVEVERHEGHAWITLIPFLIAESRPAWLPRMLASAFLETNLRTYVRGPDGEHGIYFFSLEAESLPAVAAARLLYGLPYFFAAMSRRVDGGASFMPRAAASHVVWVIHFGEDRSYTIRFDGTRWSRQRGAASADVTVQTSPPEWVKFLSADPNGRRRWLRQQRAAGTRQRLDELMTSFGVLQQTLRSREPGSQRAAMAKN